MLTLKDIQKLTTIFVTKDEFQELKNEFGLIIRKLDKHLIITDKFMKEILDNRQESAILSHNDNVIKEWMKPVSKKTDVEHPF